MSDEIAIKKEIRDIISEIVSKRNFGENTVVKYNTGGAAGEGYLSNRLLVTVSNPDKETLQLFVKYGLNPTIVDILPFDKLYSNEVHFYDVIVPAFTKFLEQKNVSDGFRSVPKCYGVSSDSIIALENLRESGYVLFDRTQVMSDAHIELVFRSLAKFHAISLSLKDQDQERYQRLAEKAYDVFVHQDTEIAHNARTIAIRELLNSLDPVEDKVILDRCQDLPERIIKFVKDTSTIRSKYTVLIQGDCWCNNLMFLYKDDNKENPSDVMLIDWQMIRSSLPVFDLSFFFYTIATKESLDKQDYFLNVYHAELSEQIRKLGSESEILYPYSIFQQQWKEYSKYGMLMGLLSIRLILTEPDECLSFEEMDDSINAFPIIRQQAEYLKRMKVLVKHMIANDYL